MLLSEKKANTSKPPLLIGDYVRVAIEGRELDEVYRIPRTAFRENEKVWIAAEDGTLQIRNVETVWRDADAVLIRKGLKVGEKLIVSDLQSPVEGMALRTDASEPEATAEPPFMRPEGGGGGFRFRPGGPGGGPPGQGPPPEVRKRMMEQGGGFPPGGGRMGGNRQGQGADPEKRAMNQGRP